MLTETYEQTQPQYEILLEGYIETASDDDTLTSECVIQYSIEMNERTLQMIPVVNDRIGTTRECIHSVFQRFMNRIMVVKC